MTPNQEKPAKIDLESIEPDTKWFIHDLNQPETSEVFALVGQHYVGRKDCEIVLFDPHSSRQHAKLTLDDGQLHLEDLNSANGTFVNGNKIQTALLQNGDTVRFDQQEFVIHGPQDEAKTMLRQGDSKLDMTQSVNYSQAVANEPMIESIPISNTASQTPSLIEASSITEESIPELPAALDSEKTKKMSHSSSSDSLRDIVIESKLRRSQAQSGQNSVASLVIMTGESMGKSIPLTNSIMTIGRVAVEIPIDETSVSTKHAQLIQSGEKWKVVDLMSANGVYINGKLTQSAFLKAGDILRVGRVEFRFTDARSHSDQARPESAQNQKSSHSTAQQKTKFYSEKNIENKLPGWLYVALGFGVALAVGAYIMSSI